jgi:hypothetical protein
MATTDTIVFNNNSPTQSATVTFLGAGASVFSNPASIPAQASSSPLSPQNSSAVTVDYQITMGGNTTGPFSIQVGSNGPLTIDVLNAAGSTDLPKAAIPNNGTIVFNNQTNNSGNVNFNPADVLFDGNGNPVASQPLKPNTAAPALTGKGTNKDVSYMVAMNAQDPDVGGGSGTIKVGQT